MNPGRTKYLILVIAVISYFLLTSPVYQIRNKYVQETISPIGNLPSEIAVSIPLEFKGITADILFLKTMVFMGSKIGIHKNPTKRQWQLMDRMLHLITDLDGRFLDPYIFAEMMFSWQAGMVEEANVLLRKAAENLPNDYRPYYFLGFNAFYFQKDAQLAAGYLRKSALIPGAPEYIKGLASRFSLYGNQTYQGIIFLEQLLKETTTKATGDYLQKRLVALKMIYFLEMKVQEYKKKKNKMPKSLDDLITEKILSAIPQDPYGGRFTLLQNGRIFTTSELLEQKKQPYNGPLAH